MDSAKNGLQKIDHAPATLREIVQERMREAIIDGTFKPGDRLVERPLCAQLGVSRTVIRETFRYLEAEGLVEILPNKGPIVARMDWQDARQIYEIRLMLETAAAVACAHNRSTVIASELDGALKRLRTAFRSDDPNELYRASSAFYQVIFEGAGHTIALEIVQRLNGRISRLRAMTLATEDREKTGLQHMTEIRDAIVAGDASATQKAVEAHIRDAARIAETLLKSDEA